MELYFLCTSSVLLIIYYFCTKFILVQQGMAACMSLSFLLLSLQSYFLLLHSTCCFYTCCFCSPSSHCFCRPFSVIVGCFYCPFFHSSNFLLCSTHFFLYFQLCVSLALGFQSLANINKYNIMESVCTVLGKYIVKTTQIIHDAQRRGGNGRSLSVCSKGWRLQANVH